MAIDKVPGSDDAYKVDTPLPWEFGRMTASDQIAAIEHEKERVLTQLATLFPGKKIQVVSFGSRDLWMHNHNREESPYRFLMDLRIE